MTATDILTGTGQTGDAMNLGNPKYAGLYANGEQYYLATAGNSAYLLFVLNNGRVECYNYSVGEQGVRPVVSLKSNVKTSAMDTQGRWMIEMERRNRMEEV